MGIESQYLGEINIPEEQRAEYAQQALKLLRAGGMVTVEPVQLYGHKLYLLSSPELDEEDGKAVGHYNLISTSCSAHIVKMVAGSPVYITSTRSPSE